MPSQLVGNVASEGNNKMRQTYKGEKKITQISNARLKQAMLLHFDDTFAINFRSLYMTIQVSIVDLMMGTFKQE